MIRKLGFVLAIVALVVNFFQPVVTSLPHRGGAWTAPWPMQVVQAGMQTAYITNDDLEAWLFGAMLGFLFYRFVDNLDRLVDFIDDVTKPNAEP